MNVAWVEIKNCLDCPHSHRFSDPGSADSFDASDESVRCKLTRKMIVVCERWGFRAKCRVPDWCPLTTK